MKRKPPIPSPSSVTSPCPNISPSPLTETNATATSNLTSGDVNAISSNNKNSGNKFTSLLLLKQKAQDFPYPIDWRKYPAEIKEPQESTNIFVKCKLHNKMSLKEISQAGIKATEQELASHGILSIRASPVTRRQCREQLRSHIRYSVVLDFVAHKNFILSGLVHEAAETVYKDIEANFPIAVADIIIGITDETRTFLSAEALVASGRTDHINNEHAFLVSPGGVAEAQTLRRRLDLAEQDKAAFAGMRMRRPNRKRAKYEPPPQPDWLVKVEEQKKKEKEREEQVTLVCEPGRPYHLHRCGRCSRFDAFYNRASTSLPPPAGTTTSFAPFGLLQNKTGLRPTSSTSVRSSITGFEQNQILTRMKRDQPQSEFLERQTNDKAEKMNAVEMMMKSRRKSLMQKNSNNNKIGETANPSPITASPSPAARDPHKDNDKTEAQTTADETAKKVTADDGVVDQRKPQVTETNLKTVSSSNRQGEHDETGVPVSVNMSGDPSLDAMRTALILASRRQKLKPMNMLQLRFSNSKSNNEVVDGIQH